jgi:hypothetical protein
VGLPNETLEEPGPGQGHVRNRCPSPSLAESGQMAARANPRGSAIGGPSSVEKDGGRDKEDSKPSPLVTSSAPIASYPNQEPGPGQGHVRNRCPSPNIKQEPKVCLAENEQIVSSRTNPRGGAIGSPSYVERDGGRDEEDSKSSPLVTSSAPIASYPNQEPGPGQGHVRNQCPSPNIKQEPKACLAENLCPSPNIKQEPKACLAESGQKIVSSRTNPRGGAIGSPSYVEKDGGRDEEDSKPSPLVTSSAPIASYPNQEVVQEEATPDRISSGWTR